MSTTDRRTFLRTSATTAAWIALASEIAPRLRAESLRVPGGLDVALVGCGRQGRAILAELAKIEGVRVVALCDVSEARLAAAKRRAGDVPGYATHTQLLEQAKGVSAVIVATPTHEHRAAALAALAAGKHVYCESPLASTLEDIRALAAAARSAKAVFAVGSYARSNPIYQLARAFFRSGAIRDVVSMRAQWHKKTSGRANASSPDEDKALNWALDSAVSLGLAGEQGTHAFDVVHWFLGEHPLSVRGTGSIQLYKDGRTSPDTVQCELVFPGERRLSYSATLANSFDGEYVLFHGTMGAIKLAGNAGWLFKEADAPTQGWEVYANREAFHDEQGITLIADATKLAKANKLKEGLGLPEPVLYYALADFVRSVSEQKPVACSALEGLRAAAVGIQAAHAVASGEQIAIDPKLFDND